MDEQVQTKLMEYLSNIEKGVVDLAPKAYEAALGVNYISAVIGLIQGLVILTSLLVLCVVTAKTAVSLYKKSKPTSDYIYSDADTETAAILAFVGFIIFGLFSLFAAASLICNTGMWITLFNKELGLVYAIWDKFT